MTQILNLYSLYVDFGRMGDIQGLFASSEDALQDVYGKKIYLGEVLGKHSEVYFDLQPDMLTKLNVDPDAVKQIVNAVGDTSISGYNPFDYVDPFDDDSDDEGDDE